MTNSLVERSIPHSVFVPYDPNVGIYGGTMFGHAMPWIYTGWQDEMGALQESCYLHGGLNPTQTLRITGPDALQLLSDTCVNSMANFAVGTGKHGIMCNDKGQVMQDGVLVRLGEQDFITYWMAPFLNYSLATGKYNAKAEDLTGQVFLFQLAGPRCLEVLEAATKSDLRDLRFMHQCKAQIAGADVSVLRMGMGGLLAYEVHGPVAFARAVFNALTTAGEPAGLRRLGLGQYTLNHTESGYAQVSIHFLYPWQEDAKYMEYQAKLAKATQTESSGATTSIRLAGSAGPDINRRYFSPVELGWTKMIKFDHDFVGRAALEKEVANPRRKMVTLIWNEGDILDVFASQFRKGEEYRFMDIPGEPAFNVGGITLFADNVVRNGRIVGISSGRIFSNRYRQMISLCTIDCEHGELGTEVAVIWGEPGTRQKEIRATVSRFPFAEGLNKNIDTKALPHTSSAGIGRKG